MLEKEIYIFSTCFLLLQRWFTTKLEILQHRYSFVTVQILRYAFDASFAIITLFSAMWVRDSEAKRHNTTQHNHAITPIAPHNTNPIHPPINASLRFDSIRFVFPLFWINTFILRLTARLLSFVILEIKQCSSCMNRDT